MLRPQAQADTQEIEGYNSILHKISHLAPSAGHALVNTRLHLKKGAKIDARQCVSCHHDVVQHSSSSEFACRFLPVGYVECAAVPEPPTKSYCPDHQNTMPMRYAASFAAQAYSWVNTGARYVYVLHRAAK
eukprot:9071680-Pyramimonas_sp.AAC.1